MINLFTSQASTWRGGTVKPVEPSFFWYCGGGLSFFYCCSFTLLSILYSTSFRLQNSQVIGLQARVQIANSCKVSMWDTLIIIFFVFFFSCCCSCCCLWLVWLVWLVFLHWISPRKPTQAITDENLGYRFYALWAQCDRCWLDERSVENSASKKKQNGVAFLKIHKSYHLKAAKGDCFTCLVVKDFRRAGPGQRWGAIGELAHRGCSMLWSIHTRGSEGEASFGWDPQVDSRCGWRNLGNLGHVFFFQAELNLVPGFG